LLIGPARPTEYLRAVDAKESLVKRKKAPGLNRSVPILDRTAAGLSGPEAAWRTVCAVLEVESVAAKRLQTVPAVLKTMADGTPVVLTAKLPPAPQSDGYLVPNGSGTPRQTVAVIAYSAKRDAVRVTPSLGEGWGQGGRAWLSIPLLRRALAAGGRAWAPKLRAADLEKP
jgi:hypothetical protein